MAEIFAAASANIKTHNLQDKVTPADIQTIAEDIAREESGDYSAAETPETKPAKMVSFTIVWNEGTQIWPGNTSFNTWAKANEAMRRLWAAEFGPNSDGYRGGYIKVKVCIKWENGAEITDRLDLTPKTDNGDFNPTKQTIGEYLAPCNSVMYGSNLEKGTRNTLQWEDELETKQEQEEPQEAPLTIMDYSEKAFAVIGDTKPIKDQLKAMGGRFNMWLKCGAGWIFPKTKLETVRQSLSL